jgi:indolepyruvate ferredoxin oxidoreductase beta subunit
MQDRGNIQFCGLGGQGILLASEFTAYVLLAAGFDVKKSEVHGMAQRGGLVEAHLRYNKEKVYSPLIEAGTVDIQLAFEPIEAVRYLPFLHKKSIVIVNTHRIPPPAVATGKMEYPDDCLDQLSKRGITVISVDAFQLAKNIGNFRTANMVLVGALSTFLPVNEGVFTEEMRKKLPAKILAVNLKAFAEGRRIPGIKND